MYFFVRCTWQSEVYIYVCTHFRVGKSCFSIASLGLYSLKQVALCKSALNTVFVHLCGLSLHNTVTTPSAWDSRCFPVTWWRNSCSQLTPWAQWHLNIRLISTTDILFWIHIIYLVLNNSLTLQTLSSKYMRWARNYTVNNSGQETFSY